MVKRLSVIAFLKNVAGDPYFLPAGLVTNSARHLATV